MKGSQDCCSGKRRKRNNRTVDRTENKEHIVPTPLLIHATVYINYDGYATYILFGMLPDLHGKKVLDIGCGMGQHAKQYADMGAASVLGIDLSEKMLEYAKEHNSSTNIIYQRMAIQHWKNIKWD